MIGRTVSRYTITEKLGEGGMGEVYGAEDTLLNRKVALKFLPLALYADPIARKRFLREARSAAALDHPNICKVYEVARTEEGFYFIAMEFLEGETLQAILARGPLSIEESVRLGGELAEALDAAHGKGIVHRDLKPANIMITPEGHAKIMDFGLAKKLVFEEGGEEDISALFAPDGETLGTLSYMSPERIRGESVDFRSDIFSLGIVLYEMLSGVHPFRRDQPAVTAGAILLDDPTPLARFLDEVPDSLRETVGKMLAKDLGARFQSAREVLTELRRLGEESAPVSAAGAGRSPAIPAWVWILFGIVVGVLALWSLWLRPSVGPDPTPPMRASILLPDGERLASGGTHRHAVAISPDGRWLAYASYRPGVGETPDGDPMINLRRLDREDVRRISGLNPFFSPDSRQLGFLERDAEGRIYLKRTGVDGGPIETVTALDDPAGTPGFGCVWLPDDTIVFAPRGNAGLFAVPAVGGESRPLTELDAETGEYGHRLPSVLPHGRAILFTALRFTDSDWSRARIMALRLDTWERRLLIEGGSDARYVASGHLLFAREGRLMAVRFDPGRLEVRGEAVPVLEGLVHSLHTMSGLSDTGAGQYAVSRNGLLVYGPGSVCPEPKHEVLWVDRLGREEPLEVEPKAWLSARISPDGRQVLLTTAYPPRRVWLYDLERKTLRPQTFEGHTGWAIAGPGAEEFTSGEMYPEFSPDGRWLAYSSAESGRDEVYVRPFPGPGRPVRISTSGGTGPCWSRDGREIVYWGSGTAASESGGEPLVFFAAPVETVGDEFRAAPPERLFAGGYLFSSPFRSYDIGPDGRILLIKPDPDSQAGVREALAPTRVELVQNWFEELRARVAAE